MSYRNVHIDDSADREQFVEALAELYRRGGDEFLEALFREQIEVRQYWIRTLN